MNIRTILSFIALTFMFSAYCQNQSAIDSLENILRTAKADTIKVNNLILMCDEYLKISDYENAMQYAESALLLAKTLDYKKGIARSYDNIGWINEEQHNYQKAEENYLEAMKIFKEIGDKKSIADKYNAIGYINEYQSNYPEAMESYIAALKIFQEIGDTNSIADSYNKMGAVYISQGNYPEALENFLSSLKLFKEIGNKTGVAYSYNNMGNIYFYQGNYEEALKNHFASLKIKEEIGNKSGVAHSYCNIGNVYYKQGNYPEALKNHFASLKIFEEIGYHVAIAVVNNNIAAIYLEQGNYSEALEYSLASLRIAEEIGYKLAIAFSYLYIGNNYHLQGNYKDARKYLDDGLALSKEIGSKPQIQDNYKALSKLDSAEGNFAQALEHYKMYTLYKDSLFNEESNKKITLLKIQYETEKKDREIELLNKDKELQEQKLEKQRLLRNGMIAGILIIVLVGLLFFRSFRLRKKLEKQQAIIQERHRISADLHDDVGSGLSKITLLSELLKTHAKTPENRKEAEKISMTALELSSTISEIIWALNSNNDYLENMVAYIRRYAAEYFENSPVKLKITTSGEILPTPINGEHRRNIFYTVKEALNNILKHAEATEAELKFVVISNKLDVIISDNGKGLPDESQNRFGNGINNMRARMKSISGDFTIESDQGTRIILNLAV